MKHVLDSLKSGNWRSLLACFLYFDTGFTVWVMFGPLAPFIRKNVVMSPVDQGFLVAVPVLAAAILRVTMGNLFQSMDGRKLALMGVTLSAIPAWVLLLAPGTPSYPGLLVLGVFLGMGGASFAVALPMAGSAYAPKVQGLVLGLAAAGNIGAVLDGFMFPTLAAAFGWQKASAAALPLLGLSALAIFFWAKDRSPKSGRAAPAFARFAVSFFGLIGLVLLIHTSAFGTGRAGLLLLPVLGSLLAIAVLPQRYRAVLAERDTWVMMLVYSITFGGFVGMTSYVTLLLVTMYQMSTVDAGLLMAFMGFAGAVVRPLGGLIADRVTGVRVLLVLLAAISVFDFAFAVAMPRPIPGLGLILGMYLSFGLGNGATFQLVPQRWQGKTGIMAGIIGAAGGIGGFYLPVIMSIAKENTGSYQLGFATFGALSTVAFLVITVLREKWLKWAIPEEAHAVLGGMPPLSRAASSTR